MAVKFFIRPAAKVKYFILSIRWWLRRGFRSVSRASNNKKLVVKMTILTVYELVILTVLLGRLPLWGNTPAPPIQGQDYDITTMLLALALLLPVLLDQMKTLKIFGAEIELLDRVNTDIDQVKHEAATQRYDHERALFAMAASLGRQMMPPQRQAERPHDKPLNIGMLDYPESWILSYWLYETLQARGVPVNKPSRSESTLMTFFDLRMGKIDVYLSYSGTGMMLAGLPVETVEGHDAETGKKILNEAYKDWGLCWLNSIGFQNAEHWIMLKDRAEKMGIENMTQLEKSSSQLVFGANREYFLRDWSFARMQRKGVDFRETREVNINNRYGGLLDGSFDVGVGWDTDPEMGDGQIVKIKWDDRHLLIPQYAMPLCQQDIAGEVEKALGGAVIGESTIRKLNRLAQKADNHPMAIKGIVVDLCRGWL